MKKILKYIGYAFLLFLIYAVGILVYGGMTDYQPEEIITLKTEQNSSQNTIEDSIISLTIWNIGYCGLGAEADFFYHGSGFWTAGDNMVRPTEELSTKYLNGVKDFVKKNPSDFYLFQEVDFDSKRSYFVNQFEEIGKLIPDYAASKATNFKVKRLPAPTLQPWKAYGKCYSGLGTYSKCQPKEITRYQLPSDFEWPNKPFMLDRCLQVSRYPYKDKELVIINVHNTAYEKDGILKMQQLDYLKKIILPEYEKGNYVIAGGDWNQTQSTVPRDHFKKIDLTGRKNLNIPNDLLPAGWQWIFDPSTPTNRSNRDPFKAGETYTALIDFFVISPNVEALSVKTIDNQFAYSDHQAVMMSAKLTSSQ